ncbi:hypothetical protein K8I85_07640, partial [bacterium]|nr:hypothetical protein [bacterium]
MSVLLLVALYALWYPRTFAIIDESTYLSTAYAYRAGTLFHDEAGLSSIASDTIEGHRVSKFAPLVPLLYAPFTWISWRAPFVVNFALHLLGFALFVGLVRRARLPDWVALLYLFHPTLLFYARTLMSDVAAGVFVLAAYAALGRG